MNKPTQSLRTFRRRPFHSTSAVPATDAEKRALLAAGKPLEFPQAVPGKTQTSADRAARTIQASWLMELFGASDRISNVDISIRNAIIEGPLRMEYGVFNGLVRVIDSEFSDSVSFSFATFHRGVNFTGSTFKKGAAFAGCQSKYNFRIERAVFDDETTFLDLYVDGLLVAVGARFNKVSFERIRVTKSAFFRTVAYQNKLYRTRFTKNANFLDAHIEGRAEFDGASFIGRANFSFMKIVGSAQFRADFIEAAGPGTKETLIPIRFIGGADFLSARFLGTADFRGAQFGKLASFRNVCVGGDLLVHSAFSTESFTRTIFGDVADFGGLQVEGAANFNGVDFLGGATFNASHFKGDASFATFFVAGSFRKAEFHRGVEFNDSHFEANLGFDGTQFDGETTFARARIDGNAHFQTRQSNDEVVLTRFGGPLSFAKANIQGSFECQSA